MKSRTQVVQESSTQFALDKASEYLDEFEITETDASWVKCNAALHLAIKRLRRVMPETLLEEYEYEWNYNSDD